MNKDRHRLRVSELRKMEERSSWLTIVVGIFLGIVLGSVLAYFAS